MKKSLLLTSILLLTSLSFAQTTWYKQGEGINKNGIFYALYEDGEHYAVGGGIGLVVNLYEYSYDVPGAQLTFQARKAGTGDGKLRITAGNSSHTVSVSGKKWPWNDDIPYADKGPYNIDRTANKLKFEIDKSSYNHYIRNVHLTMASYLNTPSVGELTFTSAEVDSPAEQQSFTFDWCHTGTVSVSYSGSSAFLVEQNSYNTVGKYGTTTVNISCMHTVSGNHEGTVTITDGTTTRTVHLSGLTYKHTPAISWQDNLSPMQVGTTYTNPARVSNEGQLAYSSSDENIIRVETNGFNTLLTAVAPGTAVITANYAGDTKWEAASATIDIAVTALKAQYIAWSQSFLRLTTESEDMLLQALSVATETGEPTGLPVTYTSSAPDVVAIQTGADGQQYLHIKAVGSAVLTASCAGNADYAPAEDYIASVVVRTFSSDICNPLVYEQTSSVDLTTGITDFSGTYGPEIALNGEPEYLSFDAKKSKKDAIGKLSVRKKLNGDWQEIGDFDLSTDYQTFDGIRLERNVTHIQFYKKTGATRTHTYTNVEVSLAKYLETSSDNLSFETVAGTTVQQSVDVKYSNIPDILLVDIIGGDKDAFSVTPTEIGNDCGDKSTVSVAVSFKPKREGEHVAILRIADREQKMMKEVTLAANAPHTEAPKQEWMMLMPRQNDLGGDIAYVPSNLEQQRLVYILDGDNYANLNVSTGEAVSFAKEENILLPIEADRWRTIVPPFDVHSTYIVELIPETKLPAGRAAAIAVQQEANRQLYLWLAEQMAMANQTAADSRTFIGLIEEYLDKWCNEQQYSRNDVGVWSLEQYNGTNSWTSNYFAYKAGNWQLSLTEDTSSDFDSDWAVEESDSPLLSKGQVYALNFPYCVDCDPATSNEYDYWSGKCLLLHGNGGQQIEGAAVHQSIQDKASTLSPNQVLFTGNHTLSAMPIEAGKAYLHQTDPTKEYYDYYVRQESAVQLPPLTSVLFANPADAAGRTLRAVSRRGQAFYDKAPDVTTGLPAIANGADVLAVVRQGGVLLQAKEETAVALYSASGMLVWKGTVGNTQQFVPLTHTGLYLLQTPAHTQKIVCR